MSRLPVVVRAAEPSDAEALVSLWYGGCADEGEPIAPGVVASDPPSIDEAATAIAESAVSLGRRLLVALHDGEVVGAVALKVDETSPLRTSRVVTVVALQVDPRRRRRWVASTLLSAAVSWAEELDCEIIVSRGPADSREANRFLTRIGFTQVAVVRAAETSALRARFAALATSSRDTGRLIAVRRTMRRRQVRAQADRVRPAIVRPGPSI